MLISVEDECGGLPPGKVESLLVPFAQRSHDRSGMGLGLSFVVVILEHHHATLNIESQPLRGALFRTEFTTNAKLTAQVATLFKGETLRGLLLYAWGWSVVSTIALYAAIGALIGFAIMLIVTVGDFVADPKIAARHISQA